MCLRKTTPPHLPHLRKWVSSTSSSAWDGSRPPDSVVRATRSFPSRRACSGLRGSTYLTATEGATRGVFRANRYPCSRMRDMIKVRISPIKILATASQPLHGVITLHTQHRDRGLQCFVGETVGRWKDKRVCKKENKYLYIDLPRSVIGVLLFWNVWQIRKKHFRRNLRLSEEMDIDRKWLGCSFGPSEILFDNLRVKISDGVWFSIYIHFLWKRFLMETYDLILFSYII